jgi:hypothetical protein
VRGEQCITVYFHGLKAKRAQNWIELWGKASGRGRKSQFTPVIEIGAKKGMGARPNLGVQAQAAPCAARLLLGGGAHSVRDPAAPCCAGGEDGAALGGLARVGAYEQCRKQ